MRETLSSLACRFVRWLVWLFYPKMTVIGAENLPGEPAVIVGNHAQIHGPIACELYFPGDHDTWCAGQMMHLKEVPDYAYTDFWSRKPTYIRWFYRLLSYLIAPLSVFVFRSARTIPVYRDIRLISTFKKTIASLQAGNNIIIFPECYDPHNHIVHAFQENFVNTAKEYYKRTGDCLQFLPLYVAPALKQLHIGKPISYCPENSPEAERKRICGYLMDQITQIALSLPRHRVVPYPNVPKKAYPFNIPSEVNSHENTSR